MMYFVLFILLFVALSQAPGLRSNYDRPKRVYKKARR
jgi:hypothetical protein